MSLPVHSLPWIHLSPEMVPRTLHHFDPCKHAIMKLPNYCYEPGLTAKLCHNFPKPITTDCVECFGELDNGHVEVHILFWSFLLEWPCFKDHVYFSSVLPESTTTLTLCSFRRSSRIFASILPGIDNREMFLWLSQTWAFPFRLYTPSA